MTNLIELTLPWPDSNLSPNARIHYQLKAKFAKIAREEGYYIALATGIKLPECPLMLRYTFHPPDKRRRDDDNFLSMMKSSRDGIFDALGQDDSLVQVSIVEKGEPVKGGKVVLKISIWDKSVVI